MALEIAPLPASELAQYATVPISFLATHRVRVTVGSVPSPDVPEPLSTPFMKDYDGLPGMSPVEWRSRFRLSDWGILTSGVLILVAADVLFA